MERKWIGENTINQMECDICYNVVGQKTYATTCCQKPTCELCFGRMTDKCPYCNCPLTEIPARMAENTCKFKKYIDRDMELTDEAMALNLAREEFYSFALETLMELLTTQPR